MSIVFSEYIKGLVWLFGAIVIGYMAGSVKIRGIGLGTSAVFITALVFGALGGRAPDGVITIGLLLFITAIGLNAGPSFLSGLKSTGKKYAVLCIAVALVGAALSLVLIKLLKIEAPLVVGILTGAYTSSPGYAAAKEVLTGNEYAVSLVSVGHGIAYPIGVLTKVMFVQLVPRMLHADMNHERELVAFEKKDSKDVRYKLIDGQGFVPIVISIALGLMLGSVHILLPGGGDLSLGTTGGPLIAALAVGQIGHVGKVSLLPPKSTLGPVKELGLVLFLAAAGLEGGSGLVQIIREYGVTLLVYSFVLVAVPLVFGLFFFRRVLRIPLLNGLGSMTAAMTCTPAFGALADSCGTDDVATAYASTYPVALILMIIINQLLVTL